MCCRSGSAAACSAVGVADTMGAEEMEHKVERRSISWSTTLSEQGSRDVETDEGKREEIIPRCKWNRRRGHDRKDDGDGGTAADSVTVNIGIS